MEMRKCNRGHFYDASVHQECPYCSKAGNSDMTMALNLVPDSNKTVAMNGGNQTVAMGMGGNMGAGYGDDNRTLPMGMEGSQPGGYADPMPSTFNKPSGVVDEGKTMAILPSSNGIEPVVGWLICLNGDEKGRDFRIHSDNNYIGRSSKMDIALTKDDTVSRENQAVITYDAEGGEFYLQNGTGRSVIRLNGSALLQPAELKAGDRIVIGKTELLFWPLCGANFKWEEK